MFRSRTARVCLVFSVSCSWGLLGCQHATQPPAGSSTERKPSPHIEEWRPQIKAFCGDCHAFPPPETFPQDAWFAEVEQGYRIYLESGRADLHAPPLRDVVEFYRSQAPKTLPLPPPAKSVSETVQFRTHATPETKAAPAISFIDLAPSRGMGALWLCDMHSGAIAVAIAKPAAMEIDELARIANPAHIALCDINRNGRADLIVAELGSFVPGDHQHGKIYWIDGAGEPDGMRAEPRVLLDNIGRISDVQPADFDLDGDIDLIVAEFGWRKTGSIRLLEQLPTVDDAIAFREHMIDRRHGAIHVPVADLNRDGLPDFVALISQEHEVVEAFLNTGNGQFEKERIFTAPDPAYGSSGIELVDLDQDGDLDVLYTNGDTLDSHYLKPTHGVNWLVNQGEFPFEQRKIAPLPGAMRAVPADIDGDRDLDVVAVAFLPATLRHEFKEAKSETLIWLEQTADGQFLRHPLEISDTGHMTVQAADLDQDGDVDLAVPNYAEQRSLRLHPLTIWWNKSVD